MTTEATSTTTTRSTSTHTAGLLDIRNIIGGLLGIYGVILLLLGLFADTEEEKTGGVNANLWAGLALLVVGAVFMAWAKLRPVEVPDEVEGDVGPSHMDAH
jgi:drug/metabolite transporter (DMT)-like permease